MAMTYAKQDAATDHQNPGSLARLLKKWELRRIRKLPRYRTFETNLFGTPILLVDGLSFFYSYREIFERHIYEFAVDSQRPTIIDGGSNIGLSIIFFKQLFPNASIIGFEPDPKVFRVLEKNIHAMKFQNVRLINAALWTEDADIPFFSEGADAGRLLHPVCDTKTRENVQSLRLSSFLDQPVDLLKLDIEGAEVDVLRDVSGKLDNVQRLFVEFHSFVDQPQRLDELTTVLRNAGFRFQIVTQFASPQPFRDRDSYLGMDMQLNIFAYRPDANK